MTETNSQGSYDERQIHRAHMTDKFTWGHMTDKFTGGHMRETNSQMSYDRQIHTVIRQRQIHRGHKTETNSQGSYDRDKLTGS